MEIKTYYHVYATFKDGSRHLVGTYTDNETATQTAQYYRNLYPTVMIDEKVEVKN